MLVRLWGNALLIRGKMSISPEENFSIKALATFSGSIKRILLMLHAKEELLALLIIHVW